jgi:hypothetical protein
MEKFGSWIIIPDPQHWYLLVLSPDKYVEGVPVPIMLTVRLNKKTPHQPNNTVHISGKSQAGKEQISEQNNRYGVAFSKLFRSRSTEILLKV